MMEIEAQDLINSLASQRNSVLDEMAKLQAYIAKLERQLAANKEPVPAAPVSTGE